MTQEEGSHRILIGDKVLLACVGALVGISLLVMCSAISSVAYKHPENLWAPYIEHCTHLLLGIICFFIAYFVPWKWMRLGTYALTGLAVITLLLLAYKSGQGETVNGATRALHIGGFPIQPIEFAKLAMILLFSDRLCHYQHDHSDLKKQDWWILMVSLSVIFILVAIQNLSSAIIIFTVCYIMLYLGRVKMRSLLLIAGAVVCLGTLIVGFGLAFPEKMPKRFLTWIHRIEYFFENASRNNLTGDSEPDERDYVITDENRQAEYSKIAIANGLYPKGPGGSIERDFLPLAFSDYIYAIVVEEYSIVGGFIVMLIYFCILYRAGITARKSSDPLLSLMSMGLAICLVLQACISMGVTVSLGPVTGQPLPLISRGGFSILFTSIYLGLLYKISAKVIFENEKQPS